MSQSYATPGIPVITSKDPFDEINILFDLTNTIYPQTISSINSVTAQGPDAALIIVSSELAQGYNGTQAAVNVTVSGGTVSYWYTISVEVLTPTQKFSRSVMLPVEQR